jgi:hypothetical protein
MALNVLTEAQKGYESLTDRLNKMDQYINENDPTALQNMSQMFEGRPTGYRPSSIISGAMDLSTTFGRTRSDLASEKMSALDRLIKLQPESEDPMKSIKPSDILSAAEKGYSFVKNEDGTLGLKPISSSESSQVDVETEARLIKAGTKKLESLPASQRKEVEKFIVEQDKKDAQQKATMLKQIATDILNMKGKLGRTGISAISGTIRPGTFMSGTMGADAFAKLNQLKGFLTLDNIKFLKGTGTITDKEQGILESVVGLSEKQTEKQMTEQLQKIAGIGENKVKLQSPSGQMYEYSDPNDPEIQEALKNGYTKL